MIRSSYLNNVNYGDVIECITFLQNPKKIVEIGILDGFSLLTFAKTASPACDISAYDIFNKFNGNHANYDDCTEKFKMYKNVSIKDGDYYKIYNDIEDSSIDILHIDIANNGDVFQFAFDNYMPKITNDGIIILEGGSIERDNVQWMHKYNKPPILPIILKNSRYLNIKTIGTMPSITIARRYK